MPHQTLTPEHIFGPYNYTVSSVLPLLQPIPISLHLSLHLASVFLIFILVTLFGLMWRGNPHESSHIVWVNICPCFLYSFHIKQGDNQIFKRMQDTVCDLYFFVQARNLSGGTHFRLAQWQYTWYALLKSIVTSMPYAVYHSASAALGHSSLQSVCP